MNVSLYGKRDFSEVIKLRILRGGNCPGLFRWALNVITCPYNTERGGGGGPRFYYRRKVGDVMMEARGWSDSRKEI